MTNSQKGFAPLIIIAIIAVVLVAGGVGAFLYVTNNANPLLQSSAYTPAQLDIPLPKPDTEAGFQTPTSTHSATTTTPIATTSPTTTTTTTSTPSIASGQVSTKTGLSTDQKTYIITFLSSNNFAGIRSITYGLTYTANSGAKGINGTVTVASATITSDSGYQAIRKELTLGTCSGTSCVYDSNPKGFRLSVTTN